MGGTVQTRPAPSELLGLLQAATYPELLALSLSKYSGKRRYQFIGQYDIKRHFGRSRASWEWRWKRYGRPMYRSNGACVRSRAVVNIRWYLAFAADRNDVLASWSALRFRHRRRSMPAGAYKFATANAPDVARFTNASRHFCAFCFNMSDDGTQRGKKHRRCKSWSSSVSQNPASNDSDIALLPDSYEPGPSRYVELWFHMIFILSNIPPTFRPPQPVTRRNHDRLSSQLSAGQLSADHTYVEDALPAIASPSKGDRGARLLTTARSSSHAVTLVTATASTPFRLNRKYRVRNLCQSAIDKPKLRFPPHSSHLTTRHTRSLVTTGWTT
ncbi:hypothetical protein BV22DRAFT_845030 [Leucogyrophana mollusca]|uniref:Uncharacterized protein n=1 Tax=Leucogyrophana mollusca TaxID=85980 RepID=A0ACB8B3C4_9AGAM|nr:hypothetical protein BV22DRAFT_845030 [Leucogyrophana mollusca]